MKKILITGAAGFIGFHTARACMDKGYHVIGIDNLNDYYDPALKLARLKILEGYDAFSFYKLDIADSDAMAVFFKDHQDIRAIIHLAAQAGVRYSIENPKAYSDSNLSGFLNMLEGARELQNVGVLKHFVYASSSSVYGGNTKVPFSVDDPVDNPVSFYAATKRSGELMSQAYANLYQIPSTGLRFFTVYGPWGRPDMAYFSFTKNILEGLPISVFNNGKMQRDFTWYEDIVEGIMAVLTTPPKSGEQGVIATAPHRIFNLGNNKAEKLTDFIEVIEQALGIEAEKIMKPMAAGDVEATYADISLSQDILGFAPKTPISVGIPKFIQWYKEFYNVG
ncbi:MAG: hypothetical protein CMH32_01730 [Micavibrio sp.]|nr:hypothetical protein [Micavibrio sp.]HCK31914.1 hypothetical protein [Rhodospirillaceae bacterium]